MTKARRKLRVLVVEDEPILRRTVADRLRDEGYLVRAEKDGMAGLNAFRQEAFDIVLLDLVMPRLDGMKVLEEIRADAADVPVIIMTAHGTVETAVEAMKLGSSEFITKPFQLEELSRRIAPLADVIRLKEENLRLKAAVGTRPMIGESRAIREVLEHISIVANTHVTVLVTGESGTGKELVARAIHDQSEHAAGPFVKVSCPSLPDTLLEAELFGHEKGAFTGAHKRKLGRFELAEEGSVFLDEIGDIPPLTQVKLLQVLQEHAFERVGGTKTITPHTRTICATRFDLEQLVDEGKFRADLYYRLNVVTITVPPLRDRREDIPHLAQHFLTRANENMGRQVDRISPSCMKLLISYHWPGNIRHLENTVDRAVMFCRSKTVTIGDLPPELRVHRQKTSEVCPNDFDLHCHVRETERECIYQALEHTGGNRSRAAILLGISRKRLWEKMKQLGVLVD